MRNSFKLFLLTSLTMVAFAANSLLNRLALSGDEIGPAGFAAVRVAAGASVLFALLAYRDRSFPRLAMPYWPAVIGLASYMLGFSFAYVSMDAGIGALVLFGVVQITMFIGALFEGDRPPPQRWVGMVLAMSGLTILSWPNGPVALDPAAGALMVIAAIGWGVYSLAGRKMADPLLSTGRNFFFVLPVVLVALILVPDMVVANATGILLAILSGGVTSALGYALWYALLPTLGATKAALTQLSAPAIALIMGAMFLGEKIPITAAFAAMLILGGIAVGLSPINKRQP